MNNLIFKGLGSDQDKRRYLNHSNEDGHGMEYTPTPAGIRHQVLKLIF